MGREQVLLCRIRWATSAFVLGLFVSGLTAIPLLQETDWLVNLAGLNDNSKAAHWLVQVHYALFQTQSQYSFLFYGTDWLAFGHFVIAIAFIGALRNPIRNRWLFDFGLIACALVIPYALLFGWLRGIPLWWRLIDCSFGIFGTIPLWLCRKWIRELEKAN